MTPHTEPPLPAPFRARAGPLQYGLARAALHEFYAATETDAPGMTGVALALARMATDARPILWVRQEFLDREVGAPYPPGLAEFGLDPSRLTLVRARDAQAALQAGLEGARCASLGAAMIELWGEAKALDLTAGRRLALAAKASGTPVLLMRAAASPQPSVAETRWLVRSASSRALMADTPGYPAFSLTLLRHRGGFASGEWHLEWNRDRGCPENRISFEPRRRTEHAPPLSGVMGPFFSHRPGAAHAENVSFRQTG